MPASEACRLLPWDSEFWGITIGRVDATTMSRERAAVIDDWARDHRVHCLYFLAAADDASAAFVAEDSGWRLVDVRTELAQRLDDDARTSSTLRPASATDLPRLRAIARVSHRDTRFYADPSFPDARCDEFYELWIERSVEGWADAVLVADHVSGYVTCHVDDEQHRGSIGLIAVDATHRGRGIGQELVQGALAWMRGRGLAEGAVVTQGRNVPAQRTFQRCGFLSESVGLWFHKWYSP